MPKTITKGFVLSLILLFSGCNADYLREKVPDYIELGKQLEFETESLYCADAVFELKNTNIDALRKKMMGTNYWKGLPSLSSEFNDSMSANSKIIFCGKILKKYLKTYKDMIKDPSKYPNGYYHVTGDRLFIAVLTDEKLVFLFGGGN